MDVDGGLGGGDCGDGDLLAAIDGVVLESLWLLLIDYCCISHLLVVGLFSSLPNDCLSEQLNVLSSRLSI